VRVLSLFLNLPKSPPISPVTTFYQVIWSNNPQLMWGKVYGLGRIQ
jgi:hypothetical protein